MDNQSQTTPAIYSGTIRIIHSQVGNGFITEFYGNYQNEPFFIVRDSADADWACERIVQYIIAES